MSLQLQQFFLVLKENVCQVSVLSCINVIKRIEKNFHFFVYFFFVHSSVLKRLWQPQGLKIDFELAVKLVHHILALSCI